MVHDSRHMIGFVRRERAWRQGCATSRTISGIAMTAMGRKRSFADFVYRDRSSVRVSPLYAFRLTLALPAAVFGPVDSSQGRQRLIASDCGVCRLDSGFH